MADLLTGSEAAPSGVVSASAPTMEPAMIVRRQGTDEPLDASPTRIARMLKGVFNHEQRIRAWEAMGTSPGRRLVKGDDGKLHWVPLKDLVGNSLIEARQARDEHISELEHVIDYALTTVAYQDVRCSDCKLPAKPLDFIRAVNDFEEPAMTCETCLGRGVVRVKKADPKSKAAFKRVSYFKRVLPDVVCAAKLRAGTSDQNDAYLKLEARNRNLLVKFGSEKQTSLEGPDAEQGVRKGIVDAAMRFDPTRREMAAFGTVAYTWCFRNSRARHDYEKRAGVFAPSVEAMGTDEEGNGVAALITSTDGALGTFSAPDLNLKELRHDLNAKIQHLPADQQDVVMCFYSEMTDAQTARQLGRTKQQVRALRSAAFEALREGLTSYVEMLRE